MPYAHFTYTVIGQRVVLPTDVSRRRSASVGYTRLVLSACTPLFSAEKRLLVYARLTRTVPVGAARVLPGRRPTSPRRSKPIAQRRVQRPRPRRRVYQRCSNPCSRTLAPARLVSYQQRLAGAEPATVAPGRSR